MRAAARLGLALTLVVAWGCASTKTLAPGGHDNARVVYVDEKCVATPAEAIIDYDPNAGPGSTKRLEVIWIIDKDDDLTAKILAKPGNDPSVDKLFEPSYRFPARVKEKKSGRVKSPPVFKPGEGVAWPYSITIGEPGDPRYCHLDPRICIRNPDGSSTCF